MTDCFVKSGLRPNLRLSGCVCFLASSGRWHRKARDTAEKNLRELRGSERKSRKRINLPSIHIFELLTSDFSTAAATCSDFDVKLVRKPSALSRTHMGIKLTGLCFISSSYSLFSLYNLPRLCEGSNKNQWVCDNMQFKTRSISTHPATQFIFTFSYLSDCCAGGTMTLNEMPQAASQHSAYH